MSAKMSEVEDSDVPVVSEDFLEDAAKGAALLKIPNYTISEWGAPRHSVPTDTTDFGGGGKSFKSTGMSFESYVCTLYCSREKYFVDEFQCAC